MPSRRDLLATMGIGAASGLAGCGSAVDLFPVAGRAGDVAQSQTGPVTGRVRDTSGAAVAGARVEAVGRNGAQVAETDAGDDGTFRIETNRPVWLRCSAGGYIERVVAARPGRPATVTLVAAAGTAVLAFGGDVMFGRRFYEPPSDHLAPHHRIRPSSRRADHDRALADVAPLLRSADVTSVNLESPLTTTSLRHPEKRYTFTSHPVAGHALAAAGVDYAALGNNHAFDALDVGLGETTRNLDAAGIAHSGAGTTAADAWRPATVEVAGLTVALLSCTTLVGAGADLHWSADRRAGRPATVGGDHTVPPGAGVAEATAARLDRRVGAAAERADVVVVQIHGGEQYQPSPTDTMVRLTDAAVEAGADLVVNHHPHVTGGVERRAGSVVAWSLGNLVFDQTVWETFPSGLLTAYVTADGVVRAVFDPLLVDGFVPRGIVGKPARTLRWRLADRAGESVRLTRTGLATGRGVVAPTTEEVEFPEAGAVYGRRTGWIRRLERGRIRLGRDLLPTGTFESVDIDETGYDGALWRFSREPSASAAGFGVGDSGGVRLRRIAGNSASVILSNSRRIPVEGSMSFFAQYRTGAADGVELTAAWYTGRGGPAMRRERWELGPTDGTWRRVRRDLTPPAGATHLNVVLSLSPPNAGRRQVTVDDLRLVAWDDADGGRVYDHVAVREPASATVAVPADADGADWRRL